MPGVRNAGRLFLGPQSSAAFFGLRAIFAATGRRIRKLPLSTGVA